jgi:co-chaperonin GroES (HSP10)
MKLNILQDYLQVELKEKEKQTKSGIILNTQEPKQLSEIGTVINKSEYIKDISIGDTIIFKSFALEEIHLESFHESQEIFLIKYDDVLAIAT